MKYPYSSDQIHQILLAPKRLPECQSIDLAKAGKGGVGRHFESRPQLCEGGFVDMRFLGKAPLLDDPSTYDATFLLANQRVRGIGFTPVARHNLRFKKRIEQGWHLNVCDPNAPTTSPQSNIHKPLPDFEVNDFLHLIQNAARCGTSTWAINQKGVCCEYSYFAWRKRFASTFNRFLERHF